MGITLTYLEDHKNRNNIGHGDFKGLLAHQGFRFTELKKDNEEVWTHGATGVVFSYHMPTAGHTVPWQAAERFYKTNHQAEEQLRKEGEVVKEIPIPRHLRDQFYAFQKGGDITLNFIGFPEFKAEFGAAKDEKTNSERINEHAQRLTNDHRTVFARLKDVETRYGVSVERDQNVIRLVQDDLGINEECPRGEGLAAHLTDTAIPQVEQKAKTILEDRYLRVLLLPERGFDVTDNRDNSEFVVTHRGAPDLAERIPYQSPGGQDDLDIRIDRKGAAQITKLEALDLKAPANGNGKKNGASAEADEAFAESLAGLTIRLRNERGWTENTFAEKVAGEIARQKPVVTTRDDVLRWEKYEDAPRSDKQFEVAAALLIDQNSGLTDKAGARTKYEKARGDFIAWLDRGDGSPAPKQFGRLTTDYREQTGQFTGPFAVTATEAAEKLVVLKPTDATPQAIAEIQAERRLTSKDFVDAMVAVFGREKAASGEVIPVSAADKSKISASYVDLVMHAERIPDASVSIPYEKVLGGLTVKHRNERGWTEETFAQLMRQELEKQQSPNLSEDDVTSWEKFSGVPQTWPQLNALATILVDNNAKIQPDQKEAARSDYIRAYAEMKEALDSQIPFGSRPQEFGKLTTAYMRQTRKFADDLVLEMLDLMTKSADVKPADMTWKYVAEIQAERRTVPTGFVLAALEVFSHTPAATTAQPMPMSEQDRQRYTQAFAGDFSEDDEEGPLTAGTGADQSRGNAGGSKDAEAADGLPMEIQLLRLRLANTFGHGWSNDRCNKMLQQVAPDVKMYPTDFTDFFGVNGSQHVYGQFSDERGQRLKSGLALALVHLGKGDRVADFGENVDRLFAEIKKAKNQRPSKVRESQPGDEAQP